MLIAVTGMAGAGKSTLASRLADRLGFGLVSEQIDPKVNPWLDLYYERGLESMREYRFPLDLHFLSRKAGDLKSVREQGGNWIIDQHLAVDFNVYAHGAYTDGLLTIEQFGLLQELYHYHLTPGVPKVDLAIHLRVKLRTALDRIMERTRENELQAPLAYWITLHERMERYMADYGGRKIILDVEKWDFKVGDDFDILIEKLRHEGFIQ